VHGPLKWKKARIATGSSERIRVSSATQEFSVTKKRALHEGRMKRPRGKSCQKESKRIVDCGRVVWRERDMKRGAEWHEVSLKRGGDRGGGFRGLKCVVYATADEVLVRDLEG